MPVAHNGRNFDLLLLLHELKRNNLALPADCVYLDTIIPCEVRSCWLAAPSDSACYVYP